MAQMNDYPRQNPAYRLTPRLLRGPSAALDFVPGPSRTVCALGPPTQNPPCIWAARNGEGMFDLRSILSLVCCARAQGCAGPAARPAIAALDFSPGPSRAVCTLGPRSKNPPCIRAARDGESFTPVKNGPCCAARLRRWIFCQDPHALLVRSGLRRKIRLALAALATARLPLLRSKRPVA